MESYAHFESYKIPLPLNSSGILYLTYERDFLIFVGASEQGNSMMDTTTHRQKGLLSYQGQENNNGIVGIRINRVA
jgi:hypothetical protein